MLECGASTQDITPDLSGIGMMGWGKNENVAHASAMPLKARAFVFRNSQNKKIAFVCADIAFITILIKEEVIKKLNEFPELGFTEENVMLSATHTHSAPGGISHYLMYNLNSPGFSREVSDCYINGIFKAILEADKKLKPAKVRLSMGEIDPEERVAFNRSLKAYNRNPEVLEKLSQDKKQLAVDREMTLLRIDDLADNPVAMLNWFAVHCTSIHSDNHLIHPDNKGYAARFFENDFLGDFPDFTAAFAQSACGDVTPNFKYFPGMKFCRGEYEDDYESAIFNGKIQYNKAKELFNSNRFTQISEQLDYVHLFVDFSAVEVEPEFASGKEGLSTGFAAIGLSMLRGTAEGPGVSEELYSLLNLMATTISLREKSKTLFDSEKRKEYQERKKAHGNKKIMVETGKRRLLGESSLENLFIPENFDPVIKIMKKLEADNAIGDKPWTPNILPIQLFIIGELAIAGLPAEFTTIAAKRLKKTIISFLSERGVKKVVISCYSNGYAGYVTTNEEYDLQLYEGGSTHFGRWTLAAYQTKFKYLAQELNKNPEERKIINSTRPHHFDEQELAKRSHLKKNI